MNNNVFRSKIILATTLFSIVLFLFLLCSFLVETRNIILKNIKSDLSSTLIRKSTIHELDELFETVNEDTDIFASILNKSFDIKNSRNKKYLRAYLNSIDNTIKSLAEKTPGIYGVWVQFNIDLTNNDTAYYSWYIINKKNHNFQRIYRAKKRKYTKELDPWYFTPIVLNRGVWSDLYIDYDLKMPMITYSKPIYKHGKLIGVIGMDLSLDRIKNLFKEIQQKYKGSDLFLLNNNLDTVISTETVSDKNMPYKSLSAYNNDLFNFLIPKVKELNNDKQTLCLKTGNMVVVATRMPGDYIFLIVMPDYIAIKDFNDIIGYGLGVLAVIIILTSLFAARLIKFTEQPIKELEQNLGNIFDNSLDEILIHENDTCKILYANKSALNNLGYTQDEIRKLSHYNINTTCTCEKRTDCKNTRAQLISNNEKFTMFETIYKRKDGSTYPVEVQIEVTKFNNKHAILTIAKDISHLKNSEKIAKRLGRIIENSWSEIYIHEFDTFKPIYVNSSVISNLGYSFEELMNMTPADWTIDITEEKIKILKDKLKEVYNPRVFMESRHIRKDGTTYPVQVYIQLFDSECPPLVVAMVQDITERKNNESIKQTFAEIVENSWNEIYIIDKETLSFVYANKAALKNTGYSLEDFKKITPLETATYFNPVEISELIRQLEQKETDRIFTEYTFRRKDGISYDVEMSLQLSVFNGKEVFIAIVHDITERKKAENLIKDSYNQIEKQVKDKTSILAGLLNSIPDLVFLKDRAGVYITCNPAFSKFAGKPVNEIIGKTDYELFQKEFAELFRNNDTIMMEQGKPRSNEELVEYPDGRLVILETLKAPLYDDDGNLLGLLGISRDITERKQMQEQLIESRDYYLTLFEKFPALIWRADKDKKINYFNDSWLEFTGHTLEQEIGDGWIEEIYPDDREMCINTYSKSFDLRLPYKMEYRLRYNDGSYRWVFENGRPFYELNGEFAGYIGAVFDIEENKKAEYKMIQAKNLAESASKAKSEFLANMSHEIRTPMNGVMGFIQLLSLTDTTEEQKDFIMEAQKSSEALLNIINEILDFSKIEAGKMTLESIELNLQSIVEDAVTLASLSPVKKDVDVNALIDINIPDVLYGDPNRIKQVLNNLLNNAIKFTYHGEININVKLLSKTDNTAIIGFDISDTGIGLSKEDIDKIFDSFTQADSSTTRKFGGSGLGLTISKRIIELMNGQINVKSQPNVGSTFSFTIELGKENKLACTEPADKPLKETNVLIISSNSTSINILNYYLADLGCNVFNVDSKREIADLLEKGVDINIIIVDADIYYKSGTTLALIINSDMALKDIPLLLLTSINKKITISDLDEYGFVSYVTKPIKKNDLLKTITAVLESDKFSEKGKEVLSEYLTANESKSDNGYKILVVEDNELNQKLITNILEKEGFGYDVASNGLEAVMAHKYNLYDMILMDCQMPVMDGYEATEHIRFLETQNGSAVHTPIIAITAHALKSDEEKCLGIGIDDYINKPIEIKKLLKVIYHYLPVYNTDKLDYDTYINNVISELKDKLEFDDDTARELIDDFKSQIPDLFKSVNEAFNDSDFEKLRKLSHTLKGASANIRLNELSSLFLELEEASDSENHLHCSIILNKISDFIKFLMDNRIN